MNSRLCTFMTVVRQMPSTEDVMVVVCQFLERLTFSSWLCFSFFLVQFESAVLHPSNFLHWANIHMECISSLAAKVDIYYRKCG